MNGIRYRVVRNSEEQYSLWPADSAAPSGWEDTGFAGSQPECLARIEAVWTDQRPLSLRQALAAPQPTTPLRSPAPDLVSRLCAGEHAVEVVLRPEPSLERLRAALDQQFVHLRFPDTAGGTELGIALTTGTDLSGADLDAGTGTLRLAGELTLDFAPLRCAAVVDVAALTGRGHLQPA